MFHGEIIFVYMSEIYQWCMIADVWILIFQQTVPLNLSSNLNLGSNLNLSSNLNISSNQFVNSLQLQLQQQQQQLLQQQANKNQSKPTPSTAASIAAPSSSSSPLHSPTSQHQHHQHNGFIVTPTPPVNSTSNIVNGNSLSSPLTLTVAGSTPNINQLLPSWYFNNSNHKK